MRNADGVRVLVYRLCLDEGQKQLPKEMAIPMWQILLPLYAVDVSGPSASSAQQAGGKGAAPT